MAVDLLSCMKGFAAVVECKGFSPAARQLRISTSALTKQIQALEQIVEKKLLERTTRYVSLTEAGSLYLAHVEKILAEVAAAQDSVHQLETEPHGHLSFGIPGVFDTPQFTQHLKLFLGHYPKINLDMRVENSPELVLNNALDFTISEANFTDTQLIKEYLFTLHRGVYATPGYLKKHGIPKTLEDLKQHNCLVYKKTSPDSLWMFGNNKKVAVKGNYTSNSGMNLLYALSIGVGLGWCSPLFIQEELNKKRVVEVKLEHPPFASKVYLYYRPVSANHTIKLMIEHVKQFAVG